MIEAFNNLPIDMDGEITHDPEEIQPEV